MWWCLRVCSEVCGCSFDDCSGVVCKWSVRNNICFVVVVVVVRRFDKSMVCFR